MESVFGIVDHVVLTPTGNSHGPNGNESCEGVLINLYLQEQVVELALGL